MAKAIRTNVDSAVGTIRPGGGNSSVYVEGQLMGVTGDPVDPHWGDPSPVMTGGSGTVFIQGIPATRGGVDVASTGAPSSSGSSVNLN